MKLLDLTLDSAAENVALDEALLEAAEAGHWPTGVLRLWEPASPMVVVGRASRVAEEVDLDQCQRLQIPVLRRCSGGAAIVADQGCLMYAVVLSCQVHPALRMIDQAHRLVLDTLLDALQPLVPGIRRQGISDLTLAGRKVSGNSLRCKRSHILYHGTLLYGRPLLLAEQLLKMPPRQPDYRAGRTHNAFLGFLPLDQQTLKSALIRGWNAHQPLQQWPAELMESLVGRKYGREQWNLLR